jgi:asparagine synthase (glutamine-hydrolysing)
MCGIAGELNWKVHTNAEAVERMVSGIRHRGPDDRGLWSSPDSTCILGHARLSIIDLSSAGHQPMLDVITGNAIVFNGEIYNFQELRKKLLSAGDLFNSQSDTEVILALYRQHGIDCLNFLRGMFALAIWDEQCKRLFLARDRVGKKPLNYALTKSGLVFCSELHPLSRHPGVDNSMDSEALELYLQCQFIPAPWTIYRGIRKLPPAHYAVYDRDGLSIKKYWDVDYRDKIQISEAAAVDALEEKLTEAVRLRMIADVPLGALLSGGVDSSLVVAIMAKLNNQLVRTFSIGFEQETFNELPWAQQAAERCGTLHHPEIVSGEVEDLLPKLVRHYGEPFADDSAVPSFFVSAAARRHVTVALNGDGGDELLGGYPRYWLSESALRTSALLGGWISPQNLADLAPRLLAVKSFPLRVIRKLLMQYVHPELSSTMMFAAYWNDRERGELLHRNNSDLLPEWRRAWLEDAFAHADNPIDRMLWLDSHTYLPGCLLVKMDIASMHCGLETRSPLLDPEVIEFCARLPSQYKVKGGVGKYLLKKLAERYFPGEFVHRPKMGFGIPLAAWFRGPLKNVLYQTLLDTQLMAPLSPLVIKRTLQEFEAGINSHECRLWALLMFGCWRRQDDCDRAIINPSHYSSKKEISRSGSKISAPSDVSLT